MLFHKSSVITLFLFDPLQNLVLQPSDRLFRQLDGTWKARVVVEQVVKRCAADAHHLLEVIRPNKHIWPLWLAVHFFLLENKIEIAEKAMEPVSAGQVGMLGSRTGLKIADAFYSTLLSTNIHHLSSSR